MKKSEIQVGRNYQAKVSGKATTVRVDEVREIEGRRGTLGRPTSPSKTLYDVTNLTTGRKTTFRSAQKFIRPATGDEAVRDAGENLSRLTKDGTLDKALGTLRRMRQIEEKYSTEEGATEAEQAEAQALLASPAPATGRLAAALVRREEEAPAPASTPAGEKKTPTREQAAVIAAVVEKPKVLVIEAGAGTGKTSTLRMIADSLRGSGQYTAFNSSLVSESKAKFGGTRVSCNTTHSLAFRAVGKNYAHRLNGSRVRAEQVALALGIHAVSIDLAEGVSKRLGPGFLASQVLGAIRRFCQSADPVVSVSHFRYVDGIDKPAPDGSRRYDNNGRLRDLLLPFAEAAWEDLVDPDGTLPFSHDHYVKIWQLGTPVISADYVLLDEAQDTAPVMLDILRQQKCQIILVGDSAQQIYEWRGAVNALASFEGAPSYLLSQSFRFGPTIAQIANAVLCSMDEQPKLRLKGLASIPSVIQEVAEPKAILCRTNAVAVSTLLAEMAREKRPFLVGGGAEVVSFVRAALDLQEGKGTNHPELACFETWTEVQEYSKLDEGEDLKLMVKIIDEFGAKTILDALNRMPSREDLADVVVCTAHKSKGREWDSVRLASDFPTAGRSDDSDRKLLYVAVTRAKVELDISRCPFFTGEDCLDIAAIAEKYRLAQAAIEDGEGGVIPPAPAASPSGEVAEGFSWAKGDDGSWIVRGPKGATGRLVDVFRKDGSSQKKTLRAVVKSNGIWDYYRV